MPTAAKLVSALLLAGLAWWIAANMVIIKLPEGRAPGRMVEITALIGLVVGWRVTGGRVGDGMGRAAGVGMTTAAVLLFWALAIFSSHRMIERSMDGRYDGPIEAMLDIFRIGTEYARDMVGPVTGLVLLIGCVCVAIIAEGVNRWAR